jgi:hypothetical protein
MDVLSLHKRWRDLSIPALVLWRKSSAPAGSRQAGRRSRRRLQAQGRDTSCYSPYQVPVG